MSSSMTETFNCVVVELIEQDEKLLVSVQGYSSDYDDKAGKGSSLGAGFYIAADNSSVLRTGDKVDIDFFIDQEQERTGVVKTNGARFTPKNGQPFTAKII